VINAGLKKACVNLEEIAEDRLKAVFLFLIRMNKGDLFQAIESPPTAVSSIQS